MLEHLVNLKGHDTTMVCKTLGVQCRAIKNETSCKVLAIEGEGGGLEELMPYMSGLRMKQAYEAGDAEDAILTAGQSLGLIKSIPTCQELIDGMIAECEASLRQNHARLMR